MVYKGRTQEMDPYKARFAQETQARTLAEALEGADIFIDVSVANILTKEMVRSMADKPIIFAMANPDLEIPYDDAKAACPDAIVATGRSDCPSQVNNVLCFSFDQRNGAGLPTQDYRSRKVQSSDTIRQDPVQTPPSQRHHLYRSQLPGKTCGWRIDRISKKSSKLMAL